MTDIQDIVDKFTPPKKNNNNTNIDDVALNVLRKHSNVKKPWTREILDIYEEKWSKIKHEDTKKEYREIYRRVKAEISKANENLIINMKNWKMTYKTTRHTKQYQAKTSVKEDKDGKIST